MKQATRKRIIVNGVPSNVVAYPDTFLSTVIRDQLGLTGTKVGCGVGQCGACIVLMNGKLVRSCIVKWSTVPEDAAILTIEGLGARENCTPAMGLY